MSTYSSYFAERLARDHPEQYARVQRGELSLHAASVAAGFRPRRISVEPDRPAALARVLRRHMKPEQLAELITQLREE